GSWLRLANPNRATAEGDAGLVPPAARPFSLRPQSPVKYPEGAVCRHGALHLSQGARPTISRCGDAASSAGTDSTRRIAASSRSRRAGSASQAGLAHLAAGLVRPVEVRGREQLRPVVGDDVRAV